MSRRGNEPLLPTASILASDPSFSMLSSSGLRLGPGMKTGLSSRGPPSVAESMASENSLSPQTRNLFKSMMKSSKLSKTQQRILDRLVTDGYSLPATPQPGMTGRTSVIPDSEADFSCRFSQSFASKKLPPPSMYVKPSVRTLDQIVNSDAFDIEPFRPTMKKNTEVEKYKLQFFMESNGKKLNSQTLADDDSISVSSGTASKGRRRGGRSALDSTDDHEEPELDEFTMLMHEIEERRQWLDDMIALGNGEKYKRQIQAEIALRIKRLEQIDKVRSKESKHLSPPTAA